MRTQQPFLVVPAKRSASRDPYREVLRWGVVAEAFFKYDGR